MNYDIQVNEKPENPRKELKTNSMYITKRNKNKNPSTINGAKEKKNDEEAAFEKQALGAMSAASSATSSAISAATITTLAATSARSINLCGISAFDSQILFPLIM